MEFKQIPNEHLKLGYEEAMLVAVIDSWSTNKTKKGEHFQSQETYCNKYHISPSKYKRCLKKLKDHGIIVVVRKLTNNRSVLRIDHSELEFVLENGYQVIMNQQPGQNDPTTRSKGPSNQVIMTQPTGHIEPTHIPDKIPDQVTIEDTIKSTKPEEFSFDIFKEEVKPDDIDLKLAAFAIDFDNDY